MSNYTFKTIKDTRKCHQFQIVINDQQVDKNSIMLRYAPCLCKPFHISCSKNENCAKYAIYQKDINFDSFAGRFWTTHKLVKLISSVPLSQ